MSTEANPGRAATEPSDEYLVRVWREAPDSSTGRAAADRLLKRYTSRAYAWCLRVVSDPELARDLAQDAMLSAYRGLPRFREDARFSSWLFAIVRNRCLSHVRAPTLVLGEGDPDERPAREKGAAREFEEREGAERLIELMKETLDPTEQEALWLRCFEDMPVDQITEVLGVSGATGARGLLQTARRKLRAAIERHGRREAANE